MNLEIINKKEQKLLSRLEVKAKITFEGVATPSNEAVRDSLAKNLGKEAKLTVIKNIYTKYGGAYANVSAYIYDNEAKLKEIETKNKKEKKKKKGEESPEEEKK